MNQIIFYSAVNDQSAENFIRELHFHQEMEHDAEMLINSGGGSVTAGYGMIAEFKASPKQPKIKVHGMAASMMANFLLFAKKGTVSALKQSTFLIHRASSFAEQRESEKKIISNMNAEFKAAFINKIDVAKFEEIAEASVDRVFDTDMPVLDIPLTAVEALDIGLVDSLDDLNSDQISAINTSIIEANAANAPVLIPIENKFVNKNKRKMEKQFTQSDVDAAVAAGVDKALLASKELEAQRVAEWTVFADADAEAVAKGISSGNTITMAEISALSTKRASADFAAQLAADNADETGSDESGTGADATADAAAESIKNYNAEFRGILGLDKSPNDK